MSSNDNIEPQSIETYFTKTNLFFPDLENGNIDTVLFLNSCKSVVALIEKFGTAFTPVKYDVNGNIEKLTKKYNENPDEYKYLQQMILAEKKQGLNTATDALMWLRRALQFILRFFECVLEDSKKKQSLVPFLKTAYASTLEQYHGWMAKQLFKVISRMCPTRAELFKLLSVDESTSSEVILRNITVFNHRLNTCIQELLAFYNNNGLETDYTV